MASNNALSCGHTGCTFHARDRLGKRNHEMGCTFPSRKRIKKRNTQITRIPLEDSDNDPSLNGNTVENHEYDDTQAYLTSQIQMKDRFERTIPDFNASEINKKEQEESKPELLALVISEIAHKVGKGKVNQLLSLLPSSVDDSTEFTNRFKDVDACHQYVDGYVVNNLQEEGFVEQEINDSGTGMRYSVFSRNPNKVISQQVSAVNPGTCFFSPVTESRNGQTTYSHTMTAPAGHNIHKAVKKAVMASSRWDVSWKSLITDGSESFVGIMQLYSDKSSVTLKAKGFQFYPVHLVLLNLSEELRRKMITSGASIVGYLPVSFESGDQAEGEIRRGVREEIILSVHNAINIILGPLMRQAEEGISCKDSDGTPRTCHVALGAYCADIPEAKDMTGVLYGSSTLSTCFRCLISTSDMNKVMNSENRTLQGTLQRISRSKELLEEARNATASVAKQKRKEAKRILKEVSLAGIPPALSSFPFVGICSELELFSVHLYEPLHNLHLGVSKLIKLACAERLSDRDLETNNVSSRKGRSRSFASIRSGVLSSANEILRRLEKEFPATGLRINYASAAKGCKYNGFFSKNGVVGMLEGKDYQALDMIFPFIGAYIDRCCGEIDTSPNTRIFTRYSDIVMSVYRRKLNPGWTEEELEELKKKITKFKEKAVEFYKPYQSSGMGTLKFHLLDHLVDDIRKMGGIEALDAGLYEHSHGKVKRWYSRTSKRSATAMSESMDIIHRSRGYTKEKAACRKSREVSENVTLVRDGHDTSISALVLARRRMRKLRKDVVCDVPISSEEKWANEIVLDIGEDGARALTQLLKKEVNPCLHSKTIIRRVSSGFVAGGFTPNLTHFDVKFRTVELQAPSRLENQRIIAARDFAGGKGLRQDCVLIEAEDNTGNRNLWVARVLALFRIGHAGGKSSKSKSHEESYAFLQYFEVVPPRDEIDIQLNCICLKWARVPEEISSSDTGSKNGGPSEDGSGTLPCKWFDIQPVDVIRGAVHVATTDYGLHGQPDGSWWDRFFYVNRFYYNSRSQVY